MDYLDSANGASSNNPAGRVLKCLAPVLARGRTTSMAASLAEALGTSTSALEFPLLCSQLRIEIHQVEKEVSPYLGRLRGARHSFDGYQTVVAASDMLLRPESYHEAQLRSAISEKGWSALCWADEVLREDTNERVLDTPDVQEFLDKVRALIDEVLTSDEFTDDEKRHLIGLLRGVEDALIAVRVQGAAPVERAAQAVIGDAAARRDFWNDGGSSRRKGTLRKIGAVVLVIVNLLGAYPGGKELTTDLFPKLAITAQTSQAPSDVVTQSDDRQRSGPERHEPEH